MKPSSDPTFLVLKLREIKDYNKRLSFIENNLEKFGASLVKSLDEIVDRVSSGDSRKCHLASFRAITLAEVAFVHGRVGNIAAAKKFATDCLKAHLKGLYIGGQIGVDCSQETQHLLTALLADAGEFRAYGLEEEAWQAYWMADPIYAAIDTSSSMPICSRITAAVKSWVEVTESSITPLLFTILETRAKFLATLYSFFNVVLMLTTAWCEVMDGVVT